MCAPASAVVLPPVRLPRVFRVMPVNSKREQGKDAAVSLPMFIFCWVSFKQDKLRSVNFKKAKYGSENIIPLTKSANSIRYCGHVP